MGATALLIGFGAGMAFAYWAEEVVSALLGWHRVRKIRRRP